MSESGGNMSIDPREALQRTIEHREIFHDEMVGLLRAIMRGEVPPARAWPSTAGAACRRSRAAPTCWRRWAR
jgi:hypothetical protein